MLSSSRRLVIAALIILIAVPAQAKRPMVRFLGEVGGGFDDNITTTLSSAPERSSSFYLAALSATTRHEIPRALLVVRGDLSSREVVQFGGLSSVRASIAPRLVIRGGRGFFSPTYGLSVSAAVWEFESDIRSSRVVDARLFVARPLTTKLAWRTHLEAQWREADGEVFDTQHVGINAALDWQLKPRLVMYGSLLLRSGDIVSSGEPTVQVLAEASAVEADDAFGGLRENGLAYRLDAITAAATTGLNVSLTPDISLDGQLRAAFSDSGDAGRYQRFIGLVSLLFRF